MYPIVSVFSQAVLGVGLLLAASPAHAQCSPHWVSGIGVTGIGGTLTNQSVIRTMMWDPDGPGPLPPVLVVAGRFTNAGGVAASNIATWNPATGAWAALGSGLNGFAARAVAVMPDGSLVVGGDFTTAGANSANRIARWNGTTWAPLGTGTSDSVSALAVLPNGDLIAGGSFLSAGGVTVNFIARWNGSAWSALGTGFDTAVDGLLVLPNGDLIAVGDFTSSAGTGMPLQHVARWSGVGGGAWSAVGTGVGNSFDYTLTAAALPNGDLVVGGVFTTPANAIARWDGHAWSALGAGLPSSAVEHLVVLPSGDLIVAGHFASAGAAQANNIARWDGGTWSALGAGINGGGYPIVYGLGVLPGGDVVVGGLFTTAGADTANNIARFTFDLPSISAQPQSVTGCASGVSSFAVGAAGAGPLSYQWQVQTTTNTWTTLGNDPLPLPCGGSAHAIPPNAATTNIGVTHCPGVLSYQVRCIVSNACGSATSTEATYTICPADFNCSHTLEAQDIFDFLAAWFALDPRADFNHLGGISAQDIFDFLASWFSGC